MNDIDRIAGAVYGVCAEDLDPKELGMIIGQLEQIENVGMWIKYRTHGYEGDPRD